MAQQEVVKDTQDAPLPKLENIFFLYITVKAAKDLVKADTFGKSDPFCKVIANKQSWTTKMIEKTLNPEWNENTQFVFFDAVKQIKFEVYDWDKGSKHDLIGVYTLETGSFYESGNAGYHHIKYSFTTPHFHITHKGFKGWKTLQDTKSGSIEIEVSGRTIKPLEMEQRCEKLQNICNEQQNEIQQQEQNKSELMIKCQDLEIQKTKSEQEKNDLEEELKNIQNQRAAEEEKIKAKKAEIEKCKKEIEKYETKKSNLKDKMAKYESEIAAETDTLKKEESDNEKLKKEAEDLREEVNKGQSTGYVLNKENVENKSSNASSLKQPLLV